MTGDPAVGSWFADRDSGFGNRYEVVAECEGSMIAERLLRMPA